MIIVLTLFFSSGFSWSIEILLMCLINLANDVARIATIRISVNSAILRLCASSFTILPNVRRLAPPATQPVGGLPSHGTRWCQRQ